jgi:4-amino-4-deoxy-L-arabinose transferase-like glycosyltransferase
VFGVLLFLLALAPRLFVALEWVGEPVWDGHYYDFGARRIAEGLGYSDDLVVDGHAVWHPWCHYPVGYSAVLAAFYRVFGAGPRVAPVVNACIGAALAVVTWLLARHALTTLRARLAGLLVALHPGLVLYSALVMTEPLSALLTLAAFWLAVRFHEGPMTGITLGALLLGLAALVRPQALLCVPFLALVMPREEASKRLVHGLGLIIVVTTIALLPVLPWTVRNCRVMDGCALVSTNAGWNLAIGAFPRATGRFETLRSSDGCREVTGQVQQDRCWFFYGLDQIRAAPARWLSFIPAKLGYTFDHESFAVEYLREARPSQWPEERRVGMRAITTGAHRLLVCFAALACVATIRRGRNAAAQGAVLVAALVLASIAFFRDVPVFWPLVVFAAVVPWLPIPGHPVFGNALKLPLVLLGSTLLAHAIFFGEDRYHIVVTPVLCMLAAAALRPQYRPRAAATDDLVRED